LLAGAAGALVVLGSAIASANGRFPASNQLLFSPVDPNLVVLRTTFGILVSHDDGATWAWLCEDALGLPPTASSDPALGLTGSDALVAAIYKGLEVSPDVGCTWSFAGGQLTNAFVTDLAVRPNAPHDVVAIESTYGAASGADGGPGYTNQVFESTDDGATWSPIGAPIDPSVLLTTVDVAASDPQRLYVAGYRLATSMGATNTASLFVSLDAGAHWTERPLPALVDETSAYIGAVDPSDADLVYVRTEGNLMAPSQSRLFVTSNAGQTFQVALAFDNGDAGVAVGQMLGFALSPDGSKVYAGSAGDGLYMATRSGLADGGAAFTKTSSIHVQCLATRGAELWACSNEASKPSGFIAGVSNDDGATFTAKLHLQGISSPLACAADATAAQCSGAPFQQLCDMLGGCANSDGGSTASDAAAGDGGPPPPPGKSSSCGCSAIGGGGATGAACAAAAALLATARRRRRR
jgi:hypothetical protein